MRCAEYAKTVLSLVELKFKRDFSRSDGCPKLRPHTRHVYTFKGNGKWLSSAKSLVQDQA